MKTKMKKYQAGGPAEAMQKAMGQKPTSTKKTMKYARKHGSGYIPPSEGNKVDTSKWAEKYKSPNAKKMQSGGTSGGYPTSGGGKKMMTGGMVNPNAKLQAQKAAGSKGVKPGVNPKAVAAKKATGKSSGGVDTPPKTAIPKAQMGKIVKMATTAAKTVGKGAKKASGSVLDFRKAATKSDMSEALKRAERAKLKKQLQDLEKSRKG